MRFLLTRSWLTGLAAAVAFALVCVGLGLWQWDRRLARLEANQLVVENYTQAPVPAGELVPPPGTAFRADDEWRPVELTGAYLTGATTLLRQRPLEGTNGFHVLVPFLLDEPLAGGEAAVLVDRGFLPAGDEAGSVDVPPPPTGEVTLVVHLRPGEDAFGQAPACQTRTVALTAIAASGCVAPVLAAADASLVDAAYGELVSEQPTTSPAPTLLPPPPVDPGPHLSYAFQWWIFALGGFVGYGVVARRHAADLRAEREEAAAGGPPPPSPDDASTSTGPVRVRTPTGARAVRPRTHLRPTRRRPTAEEEEDALLDAAQHETTVVEVPHHEMPHHDQTRHGRTAVDR
ncbi:SURF1 family cytochrome oxidase biogenesis protein [Pseudokineococcus sp. 1T1Z-3]|uniref:SURF1 family cytochrome oxidase biogenesis protein n=1 Tax=Pseudokineococcus sp. 1T1Z-3 TaxID=3132745 RepID=UPI0030ACAD8A